MNENKTNINCLITIYATPLENPYVFKVNGHLVQIGFTNNGKTAEDCLTNVLKNLYR